MVKHTASLNRDQLTQRMERYCAYQERSHHQVRYKLVELGARGQLLEEIMAHLISENFLNEERYARAYVRGKFRIKRWGRNKILQHLHAQKVSEYCTHKGLEEIEEADYLQAIDEWIAKRFDRSAGKTPFEKRGSLAKFLINKGFEPKLVWERLTLRVPD